MMAKVELHHSEGHDLQPASGAALCEKLRAIARRITRPAGQTQPRKRTQSWIKLGGNVSGCESLAVPFDCSDIRTVTQFGPGGPCIRLQIGMESNRDLKADLAAGFRRLAKAAP
ncbi:MAG: hypothetical protein NTZ14_06795 [Hyphomicrobiales bacterium]|nr:hypothetical protein [Hyphomicrobiales bacterium]